MISSREKKYIRIDGWRGYMQPVNAVGAASDTGNWSDSPCPTREVNKEMNAFRRKLRQAGIEYRSVNGGSSNVFCGKRYVLVNPKDREKALEIAQEHQKETRYFYAAE